MRLQNKTCLFLSFLFGLLLLSNTKSLAQQNRDISITKTVDNTSPTEGNNVVFTITAQNLGSPPVRNILINEQLPSGLTYVSHNASDGTYSLSTGIWTISRLNGGQAATLTITVTVNQGTGGTSITNTATLNDIGKTDPNAANNQSSVQLQVQFDDATPPGSPQNVTATAASGGVITISFDDVDESGSGVATYSIKRSALQGGPYTEVGTVADNESTSYTFTDNSASDGTTYYFVVTAIDAASNEGANSLEVTATADASPPLLQAATVTGMALQLKYNEALDANSAPSAGDFTVQVNGISRAVDKVAINIENIDLTLASPVFQGDNVTISYTGSNIIKDMAGNKAANFSGQIVANNSIDDIAPGAPQNVIATAIVGGNIQILFDDLDEIGSGVNSYSVKRSTSSGGPYTQVGTVNDDESPNYRFTDNTSLDGTLYYYVITAIDAGNNESPPSVEVSATADGVSPALESASVKDANLQLNF
ncbi:MAG TPA: SwmB domain-containing protein, partial [Balneolaceae bacterium]|nr:SwmB domain-containing protein [Balneolaceae bacterium]